MITNIFLATMIVTALVGYDIAHKPTPVAMASDVVASPVASPSPTSAPIPTDIVGYINYKFGEDAPIAFTLLQGTDPESCAENRTLDPSVINYNWTKTPGVYSSIDRGYWQFNDKYHPEVSDWCAKDVKCSTDRAYEMFKHDGSFKQWSAGKCLGI
jgi:hypothetical protein